MEFQLYKSQIAGCKLINFLYSLITSPLIKKLLNGFGRKMDLQITRYRKTVNGQYLSKQNHFTSRIYSYISIPLRLGG